VIDAFNPMQKLCAVILKELLLLWRDRAGMLVLFVMPAVLVVIITLVQENVLKVMGESSIQILFVDEDKATTGTEIRKQLTELDNVSLIETVEGVQLTRQAALDYISNGDYQFGVILPSGLSAAMKSRAEDAVEAVFDPDNITKTPSEDQPNAIELYFDPAVRGGFKAALTSTLEQVLLSLEFNEKLSLLAKQLPLQSSQTLPPESALMLPEQIPTAIPSVDFSAIAKASFKVNGKYACKSAYEKLPTSVQQNVPAWSLFGMFFIVVPLAGTLLKERNEGTLSRLHSMPVSFVTLISGKIVAYQLICFGQFLLIAAIGHYLMPLLGTPAFELGDNLIAVFLLIYTASLGATGYGVLLGSVSRTFEQVSMFGPISIVLAAAIGGVMVPVFAMPEFMRLASVISPLNWGLEGFMDIFVRGGGILDILPELGLFALFFLIMSSLALFFLRRKV
jgi:ABC-2 type transport system permease protein